MQEIATDGRYRAAALALWEHSYGDYVAWTHGDRATARTPVSAALAGLRECADETALHRRYWEPGDPIGAQLLAGLPAGYDPDRLLVLEEACLWMRLLELRCRATA